MLQHKQEGILIVMSGPSGAGKGTLCQCLREQITVQYSISATTRAPRTGEVHGVNYFFMEREDFEKKIEENGFVEWAEVYGNYYGTPREYVEEKLQLGQDVMLEIDPQGAKAVKKQMPNAVLVFVMPPSFQELEKRIRGRGTESEEQIIKRLSCAVDEINMLNAYDYVIVNDNIEEAVVDLRAIINAEKCHVSRNKAISEQFVVEKEQN